MSVLKLMPEEEKEFEAEMLYDLSKEVHRRGALASDEEIAWLREYGMHGGMADLESPWHDPHDERYLSGVQVRENLDYWLHSLKKMEERGRAGIEYGREWLRTFAPEQRGRIRRIAEHRGIEGLDLDSPLSDNEVREWLKRDMLHPFAGVKEDAARIARHRGIDLTSVA